jgi:hypothetical protein
VKTLAAELIGEAIRVNAVAPGRTVTRLWRRRAEKLTQEEGTTPEAILARFAQDTPLGRFGTAEEIADVAAFLASPRSACVEGQSVAVDGGIGRGLLWRPAPDRQLGLAAGFGVTRRSRPEARRESFSSGSLSASVASASTGITTVKAGTILGRPPFDSASASSVWKRSRALGPTTTISVTPSA